MFSKLSGWLGGGLLMAFVGVGLSCAQESGKATKAAFGTPAQSLYARHCAGCHGMQGDGKGAAAAFLFPKPRRYSRRQVSTCQH